jgi:Tfp pilus assembly protein FimT
MLVVLIVSGLIMKMALPRFAAMRDRMALRSAKQQIGAYLVTARATAIRRSRTSTFRVKNSTIWVTTTKADGTDSTIALNVPLLTARGVTVTRGGVTDLDTVRFDPRGMAVMANARTYVLTRNSTKDSICVSRLGLIARRCGQ